MSSREKKKLFSAALLNLLLNKMESPANNSAPKVSVIIPAYNTATLIADCLNSVLAQTYRDFEILVVNDGSPDTEELEKILQAFAGKIVYIKQGNKRAAGARNTAIGKARGEWLAFLDSDDTWLPYHLQSQMDLLENDSALDMVYANALLIGDPQREREFMQQCPSIGPATFESLINEQCQIPISTAIARKTALVRAGLFDESLMRCDDYYMWVCAAFHGAKISYSRRVQARLNDGRPGSLGVSRFKMAEAYWIILEKVIRTLPLNQSQMAVVQKRAAEIKARSQYEQAKCELSVQHFESAAQLLSEANRYFHRPRISLALFGLRVAPGMTTRLISYWDRIRKGASA